MSADDAAAVNLADLDVAGPPRPDMQSELAHAERLIAAYGDWLP